MSSAAKRKGSAFENEIVQYIRERGFPYAERGVAGAIDDIGDVIGTPGVVWECKNQKTMTLAAWVDELIVELDNQRARYVRSPSEPPVVGAVVHKRRGTTSPGDYYATLPLFMYVNLLKEAGY